MTIQMQKQCKEQCKQQQQQQLHNKTAKQQSNTTFTGKLIDFGAIQWL